MLNLNDKQSVDYKSGMNFSGGAMSMPMGRAMREPFPITRSEVDSMIRSALAALTISAVCNEDKTITVTLNGN